MKKWGDGDGGGESMMGERILWYCIVRWGFGSGGMSISRGSVVW